MKLTWEKNLGTPDRVVRVVIGIILLGLVITKIITGWWAAGAIIWSLIGLINAYLAYCIFYDFMGWSTRKNSN